VARWPLVLIAAPAAVAVWSGWVGLGGLCGFGVIHPLPGIWDGLRLDTAITLPVGVEAYGAYALGAWVAPGAAGRARTFAKRSAIGALALGMAGQVVYHLLAAEHATRAPWPVVVLVSCMPVITLGFGTALTHLLRDSGDHPGDRDATAAGDHRVPTTGTGHGDRGVTGPWPPLVTAHPPNGTTAPRGITPVGNGHAPALAGERPARRRGGPSGEDAEREFAAELAAGELPSIRSVRSRMHVNHDNARGLHAHLAAVLNPAG
jgi:hypothetical protein